MAYIANIIMYITFGAGGTPDTRRYLPGSAGAGENPSGTETTHQAGILV